MNLNPRAIFGHQVSNLKHICLVDSIVYQVAIDNVASLVSGDEHFESFQDAIYLKRVDQARSRVRDVIAGSRS